jgi:hypothetical protein
MTDRRGQTLIHVREVSPELDAAISGLVEALKRSRGAMKYAYEDHCDRYYLNVLDDMDLALSAFEKARDRDFNPEIP